MREGRECGEVNWGWGESEGEVRWGEGDGSQIYPKWSHL